MNEHVKQGYTFYMAQHSAVSLHHKTSSYVSAFRIVFYI